MPIYEYRCSACGHQLEALQKISDEPLKTCPNCEQEALLKQLTAAAFRLSGSGWYETDFKKDKRKNISGDTDSNPDKKNADKADKKESTSSDSATSTSNQASKGSSNTADKASA